MWVNRTFSCFTLAAAFVLGSAALAQQVETTWACRAGVIQRDITLFEDMSEGRVCEVWYDKTQEGQSKVRLWNARNDVEYCRPHAEALVAKLSALDWNCARSEPETIE